MSLGSNPFGGFGQQQQSSTPNPFAAPAAPALTPAAKPNPFAAFGGSSFGASTSTPASSAAAASASSSAAVPAFGSFAAPKPAGGGFSFGAPTAAPAASSGTSSFSFGAPAAPPASSGISSFSFGAPAVAPKPAFGGFGGSTTTPATGGTGAFGGFGALLGQSQQQPQQQQQQQPSLFSQPATTGGLFNSTARPPAPGTSFGAGTAGGAPTLSQSVGQAPGNAGKDIGELIEGVKNAWDPSHPNCRFQYFFYNLVPKEQIGQYGRPAAARNDALWFKAQRENPDPSCLVPTPAFGFDDLQKRADAQNKQAAAHAARLGELQERVSKLSLSSSLSHSPRLQRAALVHMQLASRLLRIIKHLHLLLPSRASSISPAEERIRVQLDQLAEGVRRGRLGGRVNEAWALVGGLKARKGEGKGQDAGWAVVDEEGMRELSQILVEQQTGLAHLTATLQQIAREIDVVRAGFGLGKLAEAEVDGGKAR